MAGDVRVGGRPARASPGEMVRRRRRPSRSPSGPPFVSRGGRQAGERARRLRDRPGGPARLDVGASTGGFTDCLLQRGAAAVVALDVAYGELHWRLRKDPRVTVIERRNARALEPGELPFAPDLIVADVSFISLTKVLPAVLRGAAPRVRLPRPRQAAVRGRPRAGRQGRRGARRRTTGARRSSAVAALAREELGAAVLGFASSGLPGPGRQPRELRLARRGRARRAPSRTWRRRRGGLSRERARARSRSSPTAPGGDGEALRRVVELAARGGRRGAPAARRRSRSTGSSRRAASTLGADADGAPTSRWCSAATARS